MSRILGAASLLVIAAAALNADFPPDWYLENIAVAVAIFALWLSRERYPLSTTSHVLLFLFLCVHEYGSMYSYIYTPLGEWIKPWFHTERNPYDRVVHFASGLFLLRPGYEVFARVTQRQGGWPLFLAMQSILFIGAVYEISEWAVALIVEPQLGEEFTGAQGDTWDATKDLTCALGGSLIAALFPRKL